MTVPMAALDGCTETTINAMMAFDDCTGYDDGGMATMAFDGCTEMAAFDDDMRPVVA